MTASHNHKKLNHETKLELKNVKEIQERKKGIWNYESDSMEEFIKKTDEKNVKLSKSMIKNLNEMDSPRNINLSDLDNQSLDCLEMAKSFFEDQLRKQSNSSNTEKTDKDKSKSKHHAKHETDKHKSKKQSKKEKYAKLEKHKEKFDNERKHDKYDTRDSRDYKSDRKHKKDHKIGRRDSSRDRYSYKRTYSSNHYREDRDKYGSHRDSYRPKRYRDDKQSTSRRDKRRREQIKPKEDSPPPQDIDFDEQSGNDDEREQKIIEERRTRLQKMSKKLEIVDSTSDAVSESNTNDDVTQFEDELFDFNETINLKQNNIVDKFEKPVSACFDMFSDVQPVEMDKNQINAKPDQNSNMNVKHLADNWDDSEGYYSKYVKIFKFIFVGPRIGEVIHNKYIVTNILGQGVFSIVVTAKEKSAPSNEIAIKIIRNNELMLNSGMKELVFLKKVNTYDVNDKFHCLRLLGNFKYRNHLCIVTQLLSMNLRQVLKKFGKNIGLHIKAIRSYAHQLLLALRLLKKCGILHADIKPDNILVDESKLKLKVCDFGSAAASHENDITPYLVSRFYRSPEIRSKYDYGIDMWSTACTLFEMYTGKILFPGKSNNEMLKLMIDLNGFFHKRILRRCHFWDQHFDEDYNFGYVVIDKVTNKEKFNIISNSQQPIRKFSDELIDKQKLIPAELIKVRQFINLLTQMLNYDPLRRITPTKALSSDFILQTYDQNLT
ncbi:Serine/threonine-protein kinase prp4 [Intoshia linei]|uniref:non-specific serine/threonine protein kinase n=1 Tax=Intoshia linei TaxID=1819745 RepID=A0A177B4L9_9BILA|nr:Serine/threonine-protein kinase prp4 [Intoshia linei]